MLNYVKSNCFILRGFRFLKHELVAEIFENEPPGTYVEHLEARSTSSLLFEITGGDEYNMFQVNPSTGVITTKYPLDYEKINMYNLTVTATNMVSYIYFS